MNLKEKLQAHAKGAGDSFESFESRVDISCCTDGYVYEAGFKAGHASLEPLLLQLAEALEKVKNEEGCLRGCQCGCVNRLNWTAEQALSALEAALTSEGEKNG